MSLPSFAQRVIRWQRQHGRHHLPWQNTHDPYRIWLSEIMLQQTQVETVKSYYLRFLKTFPTLVALAQAPIAQVLELWSGLGYYRRAHLLHQAARCIVDEHNGQFPDTVDELATLPGIGRSTAAAIAVFAFQRRAPILDGNVKRILARHHGIEGDPSQPAVVNRMWAVAEELLPRNNLPAYTQGLMDLGTLVCTRSNPDCAHCPVHSDCFAYNTQQIELFPTPKKRPQVQEIHFQWLIIRRQGRILLEERHQQKIWAGLWSFPECAMNEDVAHITSQRFGLHVIDSETLPPIQHRLTHRLLIITPVELHVRGTLHRSPHHRFFRREEALQCAMPAPVRRVIKAL